MRNKTPKGIIRHRDIRFKGPTKPLKGVFNNLGKPTCAIIPQEKSNEVKELEKEVKHLKELLKEKDEHIKSLLTLLKTK